MSLAPLLWFSSRYIWVALETGVTRWQEILHCWEVTKKFQEELCVSIPVVLFIYDFAGFKPNNIFYRVCFNLTPTLPCRDQCSWEFPQTVAWLVFPTAQGVPFSSPLVRPALGTSKQGRCQQTGKSPTEGHEGGWEKLRKMGLFSLDKGKAKGKENLFSETQSKRIKATIVSFSKGKPG